MIRVDCESGKPPPVGGYCLSGCRLAFCYDGADPLGNCPDEFHRCHACGGTGRGRDQTIW